MSTLILPARYTSDSIALWKAAIELGWSVERLQYWRVPKGVRYKDPVVYGELLFVTVVADQIALALIEPSPNWLANLPATYRKRQVRFSTLEDARSYDEPVFVKPAIDKCFIAKIYESGTQLPTIETLPSSIPVLISEPVTWKVEFRCFVLDRRITTISPYWRDGRLAQAEDGSWQAHPSEFEQAIAFCNTVLNDNSVQFPPSVVIDVGEIEDIGWAVVEANAVWGSGIYGCDPRQVLSVVQRACVSKNNVTKADESWILNRAL